MPGHATAPAAAKAAPLPPAVRMSAKAEARVRKPKTRGAFMPIDAARRQLGLLAVGDSGGQARLYWLVDLATRTIADSRFLAFGDLTSHAAADAFTELVRGREVADACRLSAEQIEAVLRDDPSTPAFPDAEQALAFVRELQDRAERELPNVTLLPKPTEQVAYQRKRQADWSAEDEAWFKLSLLKKIAKVDAIAGRVLRERFGHDVAHSIEGLHDDFRAVIRFPALAAEQVPTAEQFIQDALRGELHSQLLVEPWVAEAKS